MNKHFSCTFPNSIKNLFLLKIAQVLYSVHIIRKVSTILYTGHIVFIKAEVKS